ncbi:hypothetical protein [Cupriavidus necator]|uniref:hypothetical protein n=1 Tax=Cupriavidus necator TaxID=106590 RepID=UPI002788E6C9|nr:hypothetical protein [Cupriavidus necator]MDQ0139740.1 hypothetical protein [Cupriavidus necator]
MVYAETNDIFMAPCDGGSNKKKGAAAFAAKDQQNLCQQNLWTRNLLVAFLGPGT